jgi:hypothetical protein
MPKQYAAFVGLDVDCRRAMHERASEVDAENGGNPPNP